MTSVPCNFANPSDSYTTQVLIYLEVLDTMAKQTCLVQNFPTAEEQSYVAMSETVQCVQATIPFLDDKMIGKKRQRGSNKVSKVVK
jgi:hypothetical protein